LKAAINVYAKDIFEMNVIVLHDGVAFRKVPQNLSFMLYIIRLKLNLENKNSPAYQFNKRNHF